MHWFTLRVWEIPKKWFVKRLVVRESGILWEPWILKSEYWILKSESWILKTESWIMETQPWTSVTTYESWIELNWRKNWIELNAGSLLPHTYFCAQYYYAVECTLFELITCYLNSPQTSTSAQILHNTVCSTVCLLFCEKCILRPAVF